MCEVNPKELVAQIKDMVSEEVGKINEKADERSKITHQKFGKVEDGIADLRDRIGFVEGAIGARPAIAAPAAAPVQSPWSQHIGKIITGIFMLFALLIYLIAGQAGVTLPTNIPGVG